MSPSRANQAFSRLYNADFEDKAVLEYIGGDSPKKPRKPLLKVRKKYVPDSARKIAVDKTRFIAVPVVDVQEWFEDVEDIACGRYAEENPEPGIPFEEVMRRLGMSSGKPSK